MMKKTKLIICFIGCVLASQIMLGKQTPIDSISIAKWQHKNQTKLILTQNAFVNWSAGGNNSVSGIIHFLFNRNYKNKLFFWNNQLKTVYGLNKEKGRTLRKTEDVLEYDATLGYRKSKTSNWYYSAKFNFKTQFANGYKYPNTKKEISKFFAPAYLFFGLGAEYSGLKKKLKIYLSPITNKSTLVYDETLANEGAFGVKKAVYASDGKLLIKKGHHSKIEIGSLITAEWKTKLMKNIKMNQKLVLYSDYLNKYGNVDINWEMNINMNINKYIQASLGTHLLYDDDVKYKEDTNNDGKLETYGARTQLKQLLGVGISYKF